MKHTIYGLVIAVLLAMLYGCANVEKTALAFSEVPLATDGLPVTEAMPDIAEKQPTNAVISNAENEIPVNSTSIYETLPQETELNQATEEPEPTPAETEALVSCEPMPTEAQAVNTEPVEPEPSIPEIAEKEPVVVESAVTEPEVTEPTETETAEVIDTAILADYGRSYASGLGYELCWGLRDGYYPGARFTVTSMEDGYSAVIQAVDGTTAMLAARGIPVCQEINGQMCRVRLDVEVIHEGGYQYTVFVYYG